MALFNRRERIAIACIGALILAGWGARLWLYNRSETDDLRVIRNAVEPPPFFRGQGEASAVADSSAVVNINIAGAAELEELPIIGPTRAAAIVRYRIGHGLFSKPEDIMHVPGIGPGIYRSIEGMITVGDSSAVKPDRP